MLISHLLEFLTDYFTNLTAKKVIGGLLVIIGVYISSLNGGGIDRILLVSLIGFMVTGVGFVMIYQDMRSDKKENKVNDLELLKIAHEYVIKKPSAALNPHPVPKIIQSDSNENTGKQT